MKNKKLNFYRTFEAGSYVPSFFYIELNIQLDIQSNIENSIVKGNRSNMAVLAHEYIHYLQDITTTYGYMQIHNSIEHLVGYLYYAQNNVGDTISRRASLNDEHAEMLDDFMTNTFGSYDKETYEIYDTIEIIKIIPSITQADLESYEEKDRDSVKQSAVPCLKLLLKKNHRSQPTMDFNFGALAITESMARLIERHLNPPKDRLTLQIQYDIAEILYEYILGKGDNTAYVVELCDISLLDINPGKFFYSILLCMKNQQFSPRKMGDIADFVEKYSSTYEKVISTYYESATQSIEKILPNNKEGFSNLGHNSVKVLHEGYKVRKDTPDVLYTIMSYDSEQAFKYLEELMFRIKLPLLIDRNKECFGGLVDAKEKYGEIFFAAYYALKSILKKSFEKDCKLLAICNKNWPDMVDDHCKENVQPQNKLEHGDLCPLAVLWKMWQLENKRIQY